MNPQPDNFDHLLDQALSNYTPSEARPRLEQRVLAGMHARVLASVQPTTHRSPVSRFRFRIRLFAVSLTAAAILIGILTFWHFSSHPRVTQAGITQSPLPPTANTQGEKLSLSTPSARNRPLSQSRTNSPRPRPTPPSHPPELTEQQRQLFQLATLHKGATQSILNLQADRDEPLREVPIRVKPIQIEAIRWNEIPVQQLNIAPIEMATHQPPTQPSSF